MNTSKHCKVSYTVISKFSEETNSFTISFSGTIYEVKKIHKPVTVSDCYAVIVNGIKYPTFAKFLKTLNN